jgi:hypothetical protein
MSTSPRKLESAQANGAKSLGPITGDGRQAVALNSVTHGLTAQTVVLRNESPEEYQSELQNYLDHFLPQGLPELHLVHQIAAAAWRLARYAGVESGLLDDKMGQQDKWVQHHRRGIPDKQRVAIAFDSLADASPALGLANRYQSRLHHEYQRILKSLLQLQASRRATLGKLQSKPNPISEHPQVIPITEAAATN